jgi:hypothetical protein
MPKTNPVMTVALVDKDDSGHKAIDLPQNPIRHLRDG